MDESLNTYYQLINQQQQANNAWSAEQAQKAMDYQTEMSNTAHQREVADLKAAGLNPVLSAGGQGATTGSGHAASAGNENVTALYGMISKVLDAQLEQAKAMQTTAKAVGGSAGHANVVDTENPEWLDNLATMVDGMANRFFGTTKGTVAKAIMQLGKTFSDGFADDYVQNEYENAHGIPDKIPGFLNPSRNKDGSINWYATVKGFVNRNKSSIEMFNKDKRTSAKHFDRFDLDNNGILNQKELAMYYSMYPEDFKKYEYEPSYKYSYGSSHKTGNGFSGNRGKF